MILEVLKDSGIRSVEITMNTEGALSMIREAVERLAIRSASGRELCLPWNSFTMWSAPEQILCCRRLCLPGDAGLLPGTQGDCSSGAFTPSEIYTQLTWGADIVKGISCSYRGAVLFQAAGPARWERCRSWRWGA